MLVVAFHAFDSGRNPADLAQPAFDSGRRPWELDLSAICRAAVVKPSTAPLQTNRLRQALLPVPGRSLTRWSASPASSHAHWAESSAW
jgi:hypothetical protein